MNKIKENQDVNQTLLTLQNKRITSLEEDLTDARTTSPKVEQGRDYILRDKKSLETSLKNYCDKLLGVEAEVGILKKDMDMVLMEGLTSGNHRLEKAMA